MPKKLLVALALLAAPLLHAQEQNIKTTMVTYALSAGQEGLKAFFKSGDQILEFKANNGGLGDPIKYQGPRRFIIRESKEAFDPPPAGQQPKPPLAFVDLPERCDNVLVLAADEGKGKIKLLAFDVATSNLKPGDYRFFNFSHSALSFNMGKQKFALTSGESKMVTDPSWRAEKPQAFAFEMAIVEGNTATLVSRRYWEHWPARRAVVFLFDGLRESQKVRMLQFNIEKPPVERPEGAGQAPQ